MAVKTEAGPALAAIDKALEELRTARAELRRGTVNGELAALGALHSAIAAADESLTETARATRARPKEERPTWDDIADRLGMTHGRRASQRWARLRGLETS